MSGLLELNIHILILWARQIPRVRLGLDRNPSLALDNLQNPAPDDAAGPWQQFLSFSDASPCSLSGTARHQRCRLPSARRTVPHP